MKIKLSIAAIAFAVLVTVHIVSGQAWYGQSGGGSSTSPRLLPPLYAPAPAPTKANPTIQLVSAEQESTPPQLEALRDLSDLPPLQESYAPASADQLEALGRLAGARPEPQPLPVATVNPAAPSVHTPVAYPSTLPARGTVVMGYDPRLAAPVSRSAAFASPPPQPYPQVRLASRPATRPSPPVVTASLPTTRNVALKSVSLGGAAACGGSVGGFCESDLASCDPCCDVCCKPACCCPKWTVYGEYLYLRPGNEEVSFGVPLNGPITPPPPALPIQVGREGVADIDFNSGFRAGFGCALGPCSTLGASYTHFESDTESQLQVAAPIVLRSLVFHPGTANAAADFLDGRARYDIDFQLADIEYRRTLARGPLYDVSWLAGIRYAHLEQDFRSVFTNATTIEAVDTDITFDGGGIRLGLEGERRACCGLLVYGRGYASFLSGRYSTAYTQADDFANTVVTTGWDEDRVLSILDLELGVGWVSPQGRLRLTTGYMFSGWYNVINTDELIQAVQDNSTVAVGDTLTFDGLVVRGELRY
jgi:hypothetical protein